MNTARSCAPRALVAATIAAVGMCGLAGTAAAYDVAIAAAASGNLNDPRYTDVQSKLMGTGLFNSVTIVDVINTTPTLATLQQYDALLTWSNVDYFDNVALGNVFADYVDSGGGVVVAPFANSTPSSNRFLSGRWITDGYEIIPSQQGNVSTAVSLGDILDPMHPIMQNVSDISGSTMFRPQTLNLTPHGYKIALWSDGTTAAAASTMFAHRADLGLYPPSSDVTGTWWTGDGAFLMANALVYTIPAPGTAVLFGAAGLFACRRRR